MHKLVSVDERLNEIQAMTARARFSAEEHDAILAVRVSDCKSFERYLTTPATTIEMGTLIQHNGDVYYTVQDTPAYEHQSPSDIGMYAHYRLYRGAEVLTWVMGEYAAIGWQRTVDGVVYTAFADPGDNLYSPPLVPAVWQVEEVTLDG